MRYILALLYLYMGAILLAAPNLGRRDLLFAVRVPPGFRETAIGRSAIRSYRVVMVVALLAGLSQLYFAVSPLPGLLLVYILNFLWQRRKLKPFAIPLNHTGAGEIELTDVPERLPGFAWLALGPYLITGSAAAWLYFNFSRIPARFPVHFDLDGIPNRWAERSIGAVYGPLFLAFLLGTWILILGLAGWYGARRRPSRSVLLGTLIAVQYLLVCLLTLIAITVLFPIPVWFTVLMPLAFLIPLIYIVNKRLSEPSDPIEATPDHCWTALGYYNPDDPALMVERREGLGWTFNFANAWSWLLLGGIPVTLALFRGFTNF